MTGEIPTQTELEPPLEDEPGLADDLAPPGGRYAFELEADPDALGYRVGVAGDDAPPPLVRDVLFDGELEPMSEETGVDEPGDEGQ